MQDGYAPENDSGLSSNSTISDEGQQDRQRFALERDMQAALRAKISDLEEGLRIADEGVERSVESGFIDILCVDRAGQAVVIELKSGKTDARVVGQTLGYMGDIIEEGEFEDVRGVIVANAFDKRTIAASRAVPNLKLVTYGINFYFEPVSL
ncbi:endonuclease NucS domain-containing protein [Pseudophaeobacter sp.]|uniref:endonuclease NucS domain-containing protein n=1 Tax=Pseudophaeobacter sp. TaxID=1971739 RepID=UPI00329A6C28